MKYILVTGGGGFIGSNLVEGLCRRGGYRIVICDKFGPDEKWRNLLGLPIWEILPPEALPAWLAAHAGELEAIYHLGGNSSTTERDSGAMLEVNYRFSLSLWHYCVAKAVRFFYVSSYATYGAGEQGFDDDGSLPGLLKLRPMSPHGWSKHLFDLHVAQTVAAGEKVPPQWVGYKLFNVYGPREGHKEEQRSVISKMGEQAMHAGGVRLFRSQNSAWRDGEQKRDVLYVKDAVNALLWLLDTPSVSGLYNLGAGKASTFNEMARAIFAALGREPRIHYIDMPENIAQNYQYFTEAKMDRLRAAGYKESFTPLEEGIRDYLLNYLRKE